MEKGWLGQNSEPQLDLESKVSEPKRETRGRAIDFPGEIDVPPLRQPAWRVLGKTHPTLTTLHLPNPMLVPPGGQA